MTRLIAFVFTALFAASAFAQAGAEPPMQPPTGSPGKLQKLKGSDRPKVEKKAKPKLSRAEQRAAKVGEKPIN